MAAFGRLDVSSSSGERTLLYPVDRAVADAWTTDQLCLPDATE
jgi:hypothetical protein